MRGFQEIEFSRWLLEDRLKQGKNVLPDELNWLCYFPGNSKSHRENFFHIFEIPSSSRHEKRCLILQTLFWLFQYSRNSVILSLFSEMPKLSHWYLHCVKHISPGVKNILDVWFRTMLWLCIIPLALVRWVQWMTRWL